MPAAPSSNERPCPVARFVDVLGDRWSLLIVRDAFDGTRRFGDFQRDLGVARNILSDRLRKLVDAGVLATQPAADGSAYLEYVLTAKGEKLFPVVVAMRQWGEQQLFGRGERHSILADVRTGRSIPYMQPHAADDSVLLPKHAVVKKRG